MKYAFFHIPALNPEPAQSELNQFLAQHRIRDVSREFVNHAEHSAWCLCVIYDDASPRTGSSSSARPARVDYREVLSPEDFDVFSPLRKRRNELADAAGIPAYSVFSNEQLATMVRRRVSTLEELRQIEGIGVRRCEQYGKAMLSVLLDLQHTDDSSDEGTSS